ncbi:class I SAM-dependent methyltransferase [Cognatiluteimonas lumbrici]|uniref:class I SAM-dependent methyltransferase n=1 Tax=Cognatiluteimonas lumbrici TaxID=2559601 RepID=UPI00112C1888|nr:class I SAM-dependent methyltransferase [Luteimonas lumbrici]
MEQHELDKLFDQQAAGYDAQWARMAPIRESLHFLLETVFADLPEDARLLCVGAGTGAEIAHLAKRFPRWRFLALDPAPAMVAACRERAEREGFADRCEFHAGLLETLPDTGAFDGATCFLVSQFILDPAERTAFFAAIGRRLRKGGMLAWADLAWDTNAPDYPDMLRLWMRTMSGAGLDDEAIERMRGNYARDVAILPPERVAALVADAGFEAPLRFHQAGMIHGWCATKRVRSPTR